jgi:glycerol-3-phosphate cytidylyltransferase-like family protein
MPQNHPAWYHSNRYSAESACQHCDGIVQHEHWCLTLNPVVHYACEIVVYPDKLTIADAIILHSLGVLWAGSTAE